MAKISKLEGGLHGSIKRLPNFDCRISTAITGCAAGITACLPMWKTEPSSYIVCFTERKRMTKTALRNFSAQIASKRRDVKRLREDLGDTLDHLAVLEARAKSAGGKRRTTAETKKALGI